MAPLSTPSGRRATAFVLTLLGIELLDEIVFGAGEAAWPLIRADLQLSYFQIGVLMSAPSLIGAAIEPVLGLLGDGRRRRGLILAGGLFFALACLLTSLAGDFWVLLGATALFHPASGAFVGLAQIALMDHDPADQERAMARWTLAGSLGVVVGPLALAASQWAGGTWRTVYLVLGLAALGLTAFTARQRFPAPGAEAAASPAGWRDIIQAFRRRGVLGWLILLEAADFMLDILLSFLALYLVDVAGASVAEAALAIAVWTGVGLVGDALLIPLLARLSGLRYLRLSAGLVIGLFPAFLLAPGFPAKVLCLALLGLLNSGWYAILAAQMYGAFPGRSGLAMAVGSVFKLGVAWVPAALGWVAELAGLGPMMWLLWLGPITVLIGLRWNSRPLRPPHEA